MIGADILDKTGQNAFSFGRLREEPAWWELDTNQRKHFDEVQRMNQYLREEYHQLQDYLWGSGYGRLYAGKIKNHFVNRQAPTTNSVWLRLFLIAS